MKPEHCAYTAITKRQVHMTYGGILQIDHDLRDIAFALSRITRYNGHSVFSVARHSVAVSRIGMGFGVDIAIYGLLHDAAEYLTGDIPLFMRDYVTPGFHELQDRLQAYIYEQYAQKLPHKNDTTIVSLIDKALVQYEMDEVVGYPSDGKQNGSCFTQFITDQAHEAYNHVCQCDYQAFLEQAKLLGLYHGTTTIPKGVRKSSLGASSRT